MEMVDRVRDTSESHDRCTVVEVMGRKAGYLALNAGIACGATSILIPEIEYDIQEHIIEAKTGVESRACILGHIQRGGSPTAKDRVLATRMGNYAVKLLMNNIGNRVVAAQKEDVVDYDIFEALNMKKTIDMNLYDIAHEVSI